MLSIIRPILQWLAKQVLSVTGAGAMIGLVMAATGLAPADWFALVWPDLAGPMSSKVAQWVFVIVGSAILWISIWRGRKQKEIFVQDSEVWFLDAVFYVIHRRWPNSSDSLLPKTRDDQGSAEWARRVADSSIYPQVVSVLADMRQRASDHAYPL